MENSSREIVYPTVNQICEINRRMIQEFGGLFIPPHNLFNPNALDYVLGAINFPIIESYNYTTVKEKATTLAYYIISRFQDMFLMMEIKERELMLLGNSSMLTEYKLTWMIRLSN